MGLLARVEAELIRLHRELEQLKANELGPVLPGPGATEESFAIRSMRQRIEALETLIPGTFGFQSGSMHEIGIGISGPFGESRRTPRHLSIDLPESTIDPEAEELRSAVLADLLTANLELKQRLVDRRSGA
ncbi:MAG TPA: hypothetical protein EYQ74_01185 [Planctomycetes bacterium]|nr:hypothetical protein [Planctomycetota bacterium]HIK60686.1 hypothetical protein [Planctomycetota bacterium]